MNQNEFFTIKMNAESSKVQPLLISVLKSDGEELIQTADGLLVKTTKTLEEMRQLLVSKDLCPSIAIEPIDMARERDFSPDVRKFIKSCELSQNLN